MNAAIWIPDGLLRLVQSVAACGWRNFGVVPKCDFSFQMEITCHFGKIWNHSIGLCFSWKTFVCFFNRCNRELISGFLVLLLGTWHRTISLCLFLFSIYVVKLCWTRVTLIAKVQHFFLVANAEDTPAVALKHTMAMVTVADVFFTGAVEMASLVKLCIFSPKRPSGRLLHQGQKPLCDIFLKFNQYCDCWKIKLQTSEPTSVVEVGWNCVFLRSGLLSLICSSRHGRWWGSWFVCNFDNPCRMKTKVLLWICCKEDNGSGCRTARFCFGWRYWGHFMAMNEGVLKHLETSLPGIPPSRATGVTWAVIFSPKCLWCLWNSGRCVVWSLFLNLTTWEFPGFFLGFFWASFSDRANWSQV